MVRDSCVRHASGGLEVMRGHVAKRHCVVVWSCGHVVMWSRDHSVYPAELGGRGKHVKWVVTVVWRARGCGFGEETWVEISAQKKKKKNFSFFIFITHARNLSGRDRSCVWLRLVGFSWGR